MKILAGILLLFFSCFLSAQKHQITNVKEEVIGDKKLAYKINKSDRGFYCLYDLEMDGTLINKISPTINLNRSIWRYMFTKKQA